MTNLTNWLSPSVMYSLGWTLLHFLWQGTALSALAAVLMTLSRRASVRYAVAVGTLVLMLAAPIATFFFLIPSGGAARPKYSRIAETQSIVSDNVLVRISLPPSRSSSLLDALPWLVESWLLGVALFSLRSAGGFLLLERERRQQSTAPTARVLEICQTLQYQLGLGRAIRYCVCRWLQAPAVIGWFRPIVLLPVTTLTGLSEEQLRSVIAHELAHIQRLDPFVNLFQIAVETLLFYHPAVWWLNKRIRDEREHCCDDVAVCLCGNPVEYARALTIMEEWRNAPAFAMAANRGSLSERIFRVLGRKSIGAERRGIGLTGSLLFLTAALVAGNALLGIAYPKPGVSAAVSSSAQNFPVTLTRTAVASRQSSVESKSAKASAQPSPTNSQADEPPSISDGSYIGAMKAAGLSNLTFEQLVALKIQDVTPEYVRRIHEQGLQADADKLVAMRIQAVTPEYIHDLRGLGLNFDVDQVIALKIQDVDAVYVRSLKEAGSQPDINQLIALKVQDITPAYVRGLHDLGLQPDADSLVAMRIQDVTPEYVRAIHALGFTPTVNELIAMRVQDVTPEFIKALQAAGLKFDVDDAISAKVQDITPAFVERAIKHGFQNLNLQKLIQLRQMGVLDSAAEI
jgi:beta-lactamase regulating signal transducer with metallopeptidase domain